MNCDVLVQINLKYCKGYDILKLVYQNEITTEFNVVEIVKDEKDFENKSYCLASVVNKDNDIEVFDELVKRYKIPVFCKVFYSVKRNRMSVFVEKED